MEKIERNVPINNELNDYRREREILVQETLDGKNVFAENIRDRLGEEIKAVLSEKAETITPKQKKNKLQNFLDKLSNICK